MKLSDFTKTRSNVKQFSSTEDDIKKVELDYKPKQGYIKFFSSNNSTILSHEGLDNGTDIEIITYPHNTAIKEVSEDELNDFIEKLKYMAMLGDSYNYLDFYTVADSATGVKSFSVKLKDYLKEKTKVPRLAFLFRIREFITYMNHAKPETLGTTMYYAVQYIKEYFEQYLTAAMNGIVNPNILIGLGVSRYISDKSSVRMLQKWLRKSAMEIENTGAMTKITQTKLWDSFRQVFLELMTGISYKIKDPIKRDLLISAVSGNTRGMKNIVDANSREGINEENSIENA